MDERGVGLTGQLKLLSNPGAGATSNLGIGRGNGKIIDLLSKEKRSTPDSGMTGVLLVASWLKTKFGAVQDGADGFLPNTSSFRVSLQSTEDRKDKTTLETNAAFVKVPIGVGVSDGNEGRCGQWEQESERTHLGHHHHNSR